MTREIKIYNTLSGKKELLKPVEPGHVKMYACGVTPYDECHIGHAMQSVFFDVIRNYLEYAGYTVTYVRNFTDVDDKIIDRSAKLGISPPDLAEKMIQSSRDDMEALRIRDASHEPKVSETIPEIIEFIEQIIKNEAAYVTSDGDVYYRVRQKSDYGKLSNRKPDELKSGTRDIVQGSKEDALDFALWKKDTTEGASWESPWGVGRPGWHIECSAMARKFLGASFDIHGGGRDLVFPHHENEIAQSESANCCDYASVWMHSGLLTLNKQKMSKSLGNFITIKDFLKGWSYEVLRLGYLQNHYASNIDFSEDLFNTCRKRLLYYYETLKQLDEQAEEQTGAKPTLDIDKFREDFHRALGDDFNTVEAIGTLNLLMKQANQILQKKKTPEQKHTAFQIGSLIREWGSVFVLFQEDPQTYIETLKDRLLPELNLTREQIESDVARRQKARDEKNWELSDQIRNELLQQGITISDAPEGTVWSIRGTQSGD